MIISTFLFIADPIENVITHHFSENEKCLLRILESYILCLEDVSKKETFFISINVGVIYCSHLFNCFHVIICILPWLFFTWFVKFYVLMFIDAYHWWMFNCNYLVLKKLEFFCLTKIHVLHLNLILWKRLWFNIALHKIFK